MMPHTPLKSPGPKRVKGPQENDEISNSVLYAAIQSLSRKFEENSEYIRAFEFQLKENTDAVVKISESLDVNTTVIKGVKEDVEKLKSQVSHLNKENELLKQKCVEHDRYKRRWSLRLNGVTEKEDEDTRSVVINILSKIVHHSPEQLQNTVDTVHRLGKRGARPRQIIIQFGMRNVRDMVWRMSKNAPVCTEKKIRFREDFCKDDREAHARLWPKVEEARKKT